jgi:hypothetical protein
MSQYRYGINLAAGHLTLCRKPKPKKIVDINYVSWRLHSQINAL